MSKVIIDCDPGHDDAVAILYAARHLELLGITTVFGNQSLDRTTRNALRLVTLAGLDLPVTAGADRPLVAERMHAADIHGETGLDGAELPEPARPAAPGHAVDWLIEQARAHAGELVIAPVGPLTNIALAIRREPRLAEWVARLSIMGGSTTTGNVTPAAEFNIACDPEAAAIVFASGIPTRMVGLNVTRTVGVTRADIARLKESGRKVATAAAGFLDFYLGRQSRTYALDSAPMHDACAIVPEVRPGLIRYYRTRVEIELAGRHTRGKTVCDMRHGDEALVPDPNAEVAVEAEGRRIIDDVVATLLSYD